MLRKPKAIISEELEVQQQQHNHRFTAIICDFRCHPPFPLLTKTLPGSSASDVTTLWRYTKLFIIIIIYRDNQK